jgi:hypothetical protein
LYGSRYCLPGALAGLRGRPVVPWTGFARIAFALEGNPEDYDPVAEAVTLDVKVAPAA